MIIHENPEKQAQSKSPYPQQSAPLLQSAAGGCSRGADLGRYTDFTPALVFNKTKIEKNLKRIYRYELLDLARKISGKDKNGKYYRNVGCSKYFGLDKEGKAREFVSLRRTPNGSHWYGVAVCGSVWQCPVCAEKIMTGKRNEIQIGMRRWRELGGLVLMVTRTFSHYKSEGLEENIEQLRKAISRMKAGRPYKRIMEKLGRAGDIASLEMTYGNKNGWHPHTHELLFIENHLSESQVAEIQEEYYQLWARFCVKYGLGKPSRAHGLRIDYRPGDQEGTIGDYISKWGFELTSSHTKYTDKGRSPWTILADLKNEWNAKDSMLWKEYLNATMARSLCRWSPGLRKLLDVKEITEQEYAESEHEREIIEELKVSREEFFAIVREGKIAHVKNEFDESLIEASIMIDNIVKEDKRKRLEDATRYKDLEKAIYNSTMQGIKKLNLDFIH